ncbi:hypothetical protein GGI23_001291 [Coemansia sp. RSA 2559]|nr:hypothetical protein GGI23_001291 [Coemansia sp. RSA 2559]
MAFEMWTPVPVRNAITGQQQQQFDVLCIGGCCVVCQSCGHRSLISPSAHNVPLCVCCETPLELPLEAHFACTAKLEKSFAIMQAFDIEGFFAETAHELSNRRTTTPGELAARAIVGFVDIDISRTDMMQHDADWCPADKHIAKGGIWRSMLASFGLRSTKSKHGGIPIASKKHALAVIVDGALSVYVVHKKPTTISGGGKHQLRRSVYEQIFSLPLDSVQGLEEHSQKPLSGVVVNGKDVRMEMSLGSSSVANMWMQMLSKHVDLNKHQHRHQYQQPASDEFLFDSAVAKKCISSSEYNLDFNEKGANERVLRYNMDADRRVASMTSSGGESREHNASISLIAL